MSSKARGARAPSFSKADTAETYAQLDTAHGHCLSLIATCTRLGDDLRDTEMLKHVSDLTALADACERVSGRVAELHADLSKIHSRDLRNRSKRVGPDNIMLVLSAGQEYEAWLTRFSQGVSPNVDTACRLIDEARTKQNTNTGSTV